MRLDRKNLRKILLKEACGCMGMDNHELDDYSYEMDYDSHHEDPNPVMHGSIDKDSVLNAIATLAMAVDCPVTRDTLLSTVQELMG